MRKNLLLYITAFVLFTVVLIFFNRAYQAMTSYSDLTGRQHTVYSIFQNLSKKMNNAAVLNPELSKAISTSKTSELFYIDSLAIIRELNLLRSTVRDPVNVMVAAKLDTAIHRELSWILNNNVPDSIISHRSPQHIASFQKINSLINQGIERTVYLVAYRKKQLDDEISRVSLWAVIIIIASGLLTVYTTNNLFRQQAKRKRKEKELEIVFNRISDGVVSVDRNWRYTFLNDAAMATHPFSKEETLGKVIWDIHPEMKGTIFWDKYHEAMISKEPQEIEEHYAPMNIWFSVKVYPSDDGLTIFYKDITETKRAGQRLSETVKEVADYKYAMEESSIVAITDQKGTIKHANDNFCKISKYSREELIGQDHRIINSGFHKKEFIRDLWVTIANGNIWRGELKNQAKDGTIYWVDTTIVPFLDDKDKPYQYVAIRADITERKKIEENLQQSLKEVSDYKYALDESSILAITDQKGIIKHANHNFCKISRYSLDELIGQDHRIINSGYHPKEFIRNLWVTIANGKIWRGELKNKAKDGTHYWVDTTIVPFLDEAGKPYQYVAIRSDITQRKNVEEEIRTLNEGLEKRIKERTEEIESFSYSVSHDLRTPLRAVNGYARILEEEYDHLFDDEGKRLLYEVQGNATKMGVLIDDLLAFSRLGRKEVEKSMVDMNKLVSLAIKEINQTTDHHAVITVGELQPVMADHALMVHVMINLISNAIKYSSKKEDPKIEITSSKNNAELVYSIKDNGTGFDMEYKDKLFGVFQRLHSADEFPGTGVGLAMVQRIIHKHKGTIWAEGKEGEGAVFYFSLPGIS